jgi:S1-C subfamily serine protease
MSIHLNSELIGPISMSRHSMRGMCLLAFVLLVVTAVAGQPTTGDPPGSKTAAKAATDFRLAEAARRGRPIAVGGPGQLVASLSQLERELWKPSVNREQVRGQKEQEVYASAAPAIVVVRTQFGHGSGFVIDPAGWIVTNHHVIADADVDSDSGAPVATVHFGARSPDGLMELLGDSVPALVFKSSKDKDLALLKIKQAPKGMTRIATVGLAKSETTPGASCIAIGHPAAGVLWSLRTGTVSGVGRFPHDLMRNRMLQLNLTSSEEQASFDRAMNPPLKVVLSDCAINPGDSGGPLLDMDGNVIAVTFATPRELRLDRLAYHIHIDEVRAFLSDRPATPERFTVDPWGESPLGSIADMDGDGIPDTIFLKGADPGSVTGFVLDLSERAGRQVDLSKATPAQIRSAWGVQMAFQQEPVHRAYYDTDNDGQIDLVLTDLDGDGVADQALSWSGKHWSHSDSHQRLIDPTLFQEASIQQRFGKILRMISKVASK